MKAGLGLPAYDTTLEAQNRLRVASIETGIRCGSCEVELVSQKEARLLDWVS